MRSCGEMHVLNRAHTRQGPSGPSPRFDLRLPALRPPGARQRVIRPTCAIVRSARHAQCPRSAPVRATHAWHAGGVYYCSASSASSPAAHDSLDAVCGRFPRPAVAVIETTPPGAAAGLLPRLRQLPPSQASLSPSAAIGGACAARRRSRGAEAGGGSRSHVRLARGEAATSCHGTGHRKHKVFNFSSRQRERTGTA